MPKIVVFAEDLSEVTAEQIRVADAVVPFAADNQTMMSLLKLIQQGERIIPSALLHRMPVQKPPPEPLPRMLLSPREQQVVQMLAEGDANKVMARKLGITEATVKVHLKSVLRKIGVANRTQAALWGLSNPTELTYVPTEMVAGALAAND